MGNGCGVSMRRGLGPDLKVQQMHVERTACPAKGPVLG